MLIGGAGVLLCSGCRTPAQQRRSVQFTRWGGYLEFIARDRDDDQTSKTGSGDSSSKETIFEENLKLETEGYVYHPNFLEFALGGLFGLSQHEFEDDFGGRRRSSSDDGTIVEFDLNGRFLKKKKYPGTVFARRYRSLEPRPFQSTLEVTATNYGLIWQYVDEKIPSSVQFSHSDVRLDPLSGREQEGRQTNTVFRLETEYRFSDHNVLSFTYHRDSSEETPFDLVFDSDELTLAHRLDLGPGAGHRLDSELNYFRQTGSFDIDRWRWRELLRLQHSESLRSWYQLEVLERTQGNLAGVQPIDEHSVFFSGTLEHQLYQSLVSQFYGYVQSQSFDPDLDINRFGLQASFDYRKKNPWGVLLADYRARFQQEDRDGSGQTVAVTDQRVTFRDPQPVVLPQANIIIGSIVITSEDRLTLFQPVRDYTVQAFADRVELRRVVTGRIADGQTVLIDYVFGVGGTSTLDTVGQSFGIRQNFAFGLSPYYRLRWQDQELTPADALGITAEDITAHLVGVEYEKRPFRFQIEFEDHDSNINPFKAWRLSADYTQHFDWDGSGSIKVRWTDVSQAPPVNRDITFFSIEGRYRQELLDSLSLEGAVLYRTEDDSITGKSNGLDLDLALEWSYRETDVRITYEFSDFEDDFARNETSGLFVQIRRSF